MCIEDLRPEETGNNRWLEFLDEVDHHFIKFQDDTCHSFALYGQNIPENIKVGLKPSPNGRKHTGHIHASRWAPWLTPENRAALEYDPSPDPRHPNFDPVSYQLPAIMQALVDHDYDGLFSLEAPHLDLRSALGRGDPKEVELLNKDAKDKFALEETKVSLERILKVRNDLERKLNQR